ncbi:MAG: diacylglycerol kinase [Rubrivivax sp.]|jgi:diacylglycerol kinase (ATP)
MMSTDSGNGQAGNPYKTHTGWRRVIRATGHSARGLRAAWHCESAFRQECVLFLVLLPLGLWLGGTWVERALLVGTAGLVLIVELLNSAIETAVDRISLEHHELSKRSKDLGSAAVMLSLLLCAAVWVSAVWVRFST